MSENQVGLLGAGLSTFGRHTGKRIEDLAYQAIDTALSIAEIEPADVDAVYVGNVFGPSGVGSRVLRAAGLTGIPVIRVEAACASGTLAAHLAVQDVRERSRTCVLAVGVEQMSMLFNGAIVPENSDSEGALGLAMPGMYALSASRYMSEHKLDPDALGLVAVKNRANGVRNRYAQRQLGVSLEDVMASRMIADPLTVLQCCPVSDGAAAAVFGAIPRHPATVRVGASAFVAGRAWPADIDEPWGVACVRRAAQEAAKQLGRPSLVGMDLYEVHDAFTIGELTTIEGLGLCDTGQASRLLMDGDLHPDGRMPVNVSGGLLSRGHALGATGLAQIAQCFEQLTDRAGTAQLASANTALIETLGGGASGLDGNAAVVMTLET